MLLPFAPILVGSQLLVAAAADLPNVDIRKTCEAASGVMAELMTGGMAQHDLDVCLSSEQTAREPIIKDGEIFIGRGEAVRAAVGLFAELYRMANLSGNGNVGEKTQLWPSNSTHQIPAHHKGCA